MNQTISYLKAQLDKCDEDNNNFKLINFLHGQLNLSRVKKNARHYRPNILLFAYMVLFTSASAYKAILRENVVCLPFVATTGYVTMRLDQNTELDNAEYLKLRAEKLSQYKRTVLLMIDEIYVARRIEYNGGNVYSVTNTREVASTSLSLMINSVGEPYKNLISIYPISQLTADKQCECYKEVFSLFNSITLTVLATSVDNAPANRKFFIDFLCDENLSTHIIDHTTGQPIYLLFDPVHDFKNIYNNFQSKKVFELSLFGVLPEGCVANFKHLADLKI